jgi:nucleotide-binding universal stress UspA family protein
MKRMKTILAPVDFTDVSSKTAATAYSLIDDVHVDLVFIHVMPAKVTSRFLPASSSVYPNAFQEIEVRAVDKLRDLVRKARIQGISATYLLAYGSPAAEILSAAKRIRADLIVMGSHDYNSPEGSVVGTTTKTVLYATPCPIVIVPSDHATTLSTREFSSNAAN